jgi:hypothetical protein
MACTKIHYLRDGGPVPRPRERNVPFVDEAGGNVVTFDGSSWSAPVNIDPEAANSDREPVLIFLMSVSCLSAEFCVAGDSIGDAFVTSGPARLGGRGRR